ncbi:MULTISPECIES: family 43 glycosylhydrolase [Nostocales]|uniref:Family 43 glycosylhydrolase n=3 Tax=Nostocales TaxID=1161 RepID=A0A8S9T7I6_9CYAN|nr:family 43 glycosylhydrolase [Tolypothrix bouteillei]KAF3888511.1 family 43 glycosylhydrolase [Tolypothrix bouteillei VB521301]
MRYLRKFSVLFIASLLAVAIFGVIGPGNLIFSANSSLAIKNSFARSPTFNFYNVLTSSGADPWVYKHTDGYYYMTYLTNQNITIFRSLTLSGIVGGERKTVWTPPKSGSNSQNIWAPELHFLDGKWYIYYTADDGNTLNHRMFVLENASPDPFRGNFVDRGKIFDKKNDKWAIDGTVLTVSGKRYFIWSGWEGDNNVQQNLYIAPMSNPTTLGSSRVKISSPTYPWESFGSPPTVNEGPQVIIKDKTINLIYSASVGWTNNYALGLLTAKVGSNLLSPSAWRKYKEPVFQSGNGVVSPGHSSFVKSPNNKEDWIVYHAANFLSAGWNRHIRTQRFGWNRDGTPNFGSPAPVNAPISLPSGEPQHDRYQAEDALFTGAAKIISNPNASNGAKVGYIDNPQSNVEFRVRVNKRGTYNMSVRFGNGTEGGKEASHKLYINGKELPALRYVWTGWDNWLNSVIRVQLNTGVNQIRFSKGENFAEIDSIDIFPLR